MKSRTLPFTGCLFVSLCLVCAMGNEACASSPGAAVESVKPSIEVLALSRGRGVPEAAAKALQAIEALAESERKSGSVMSIRRELIGLEGEIRLCIVFRNLAASTKVGERIQELASGIDLLQVRKRDCSQK